MRHLGLVLAVAACGGGGGSTPDARAPIDGAHAIDDAAPADAAPPDALAIDAVPPDAAPPCATVQVLPTSATIGNAAATGLTFDVTVQPAGCAWSATTADTWITVTTPAGAGDGTVTYDAAANTVTASTRGATIDVSGATFSITQDGATCAFTVNPMSNQVADTGGAFSADVTASPADCTWTPQSDSAWILVAATPQTGNATFDYAVEPLAHTAPARSGSIAIGPGVALAISQAH